jgi:hypothetical protein
MTREVPKRTLRPRSAFLTCKTGDPSADWAIFIALRPAVHRDLRIAPKRCHPVVDIRRVKAWIDYWFIPGTDRTLKLRTVHCGVTLCW